METPRPTRSAEPEIHFAGGLHVPRSGDVSDPAVHAAFLAFHRILGTATRDDARKGFISRGGLALTVLTLLGFGGGLSLAVFSFNSPETTRSEVAGRAPEIIYTAPAAAVVAEQAEPVPIYEAPSELPLLADTAFELRAPDQPVPETSVWRDADRAMLASFGDSYARGGGFSFNSVPDQSFPGGSTLGGPAGDITSGFDALTAAPVPEPSTWATMISGAGLLVLFGKLKRRRS